MPYALIFLIAALVLFVIETFTVQSRFNLTAAGLACSTVYILLTQGLTG